MVEEAVKEWTLTANDRCDSKACGAQAYVKVVGSSGCILFCSHHYDGIMNNSKGHDKMMSFMVEVVDERERLIENRTKGED
jgi:hypothetical protein